MDEVEWMSAYLARNENILRKSLDNSVWKKISYRMGNNRCSKNLMDGTSLMIQWLRIPIAMPGTKIQFLVGELRSHMPGIS